MNPSTSLKVAAATTATLLLSTACLSSDGGSDTGGGEASGDVKGSTVTIWTSYDQPVIDGFDSFVAPKAEAMGITVKFQKVDNINQLVVTKIQAGQPPDIALVPQPGVVADIAKRGAAYPLDFLDMDALTESMVPGTLEAGTIDGKLYGLLMGINVKSVVFYPKPAWDAAGYEAPTSIDGLNALTEQLKADGQTPWCMGLGADTATGWPATDWFEDLIARYGGVEGYNDWVSHKIPFDSDLVRKAAAEFELLFFTKGNTVGGRDALASTPFGQAANPMFNADGPGCWLLKQGTFITQFMPDAIQADLDNQVGIFGFPPATEGGDNPVMGGGDIAMLLKNTKAGEEVMKLMSQTDVGVESAKAGTGYLSPHKDIDMSAYPNSIATDSAEIAYNSTYFLFDGSDQMPGAVGAGTFWRDMTSWVSGQESLDDALKNIDASWPSS